MAVTEPAAATAAPAFLTAIKTHLIGLPDQIAALEDKVYEAGLKVEVAKANLKGCDVGMIMAIENDVDPATGKARFGNEAKRSCELVTRRAASTTYLAYEKGVADAELAFSKAKIELNRLVNTFSGQRHLADLFAGYLKRSA